MAIRVQRANECHTMQNVISIGQTVAEIMEMFILSL